MSGELVFVTTRPTVVFGCILVVATLALSIWSLRRLERARGMGWLETLRVILAILLALTLNQPEWREEYEPEHPPTVAVLWDNSRSMETQDVLQPDGTNLSRANAVDKLIQSEKWTSIANAEVVLEAFASSEEKNRQATDLNAALQTSLDRHPNLRAAVLISDGDWNEGLAPVRGAGEFRARKIPVHTVATGSTSFLPDLSVSSLDAPTFAIAGKPIRIPYVLKSTLPREHQTTITLKSSTGEQVQEQVVIPAMGRLESAITWRTSTLGDVELTLNLPSAPKEIDPNNNSQSATLAIRKEELKVLIIESFPRWEYRFLRNALERDPGVEVDCLLFHPDLPSVGKGRRYLEAFPSQGRLTEYDVIFLGDIGIGPKQLTTENCTRIQKLVRDQASGVVFLPGLRGNQHSLLESSLSELYPVISDPERKAGIGSAVPSRIILTEEGRKSLLTKLDDNDISNERIWRTLPGFQWHAAVIRAKAGTTTLARHSNARSSNGRTPLLVTKTYGTGKVLYLGTDSAWRWREGVEDRFHYRFWGQVARWMAYQRKMSEGKNMRLFHSPDRPTVGDMITLNANISSLQGEPLREAIVTVQVASPSGNTETVRLQPAGKESWGLFTGKFNPSEPGDHNLYLTTDQYPEPLQTSLTIRGGALEKTGHPARLEVLEEIAEVTRGSLVRPDQLDSVIQAIIGLPEPEALERRLQLWAHPLWAGFIILLLALFWIGRKMAGAM